MSKIITEKELVTTDLATAMETEGFTEDDIAPFVKWAGGKRQLMDRILPMVPDVFENYHEPFLGGGALFYELKKRGRIQRIAYLSDLISELIDAYVIVRNKPRSVMNLLNSVMFVNSSDVFYEVRSWEPSSLDILTRAARMIYLNNTCFNGLYRVNKSGQFNASYAKAPDRPTYDEANIMAASWALESVILGVEDFEGAVLRRVKPGDFCYFDPPFWQKYQAYTGNKFGWSDHVRLLSLCIKLDKMDVKWLASNSDHEDIWRLYDGFIIERVSKNVVINSDASNRTGATELLIRNYGDD